MHEQKFFIKKYKMSHIASFSEKNELIADIFIFNKRHLLLDAYLDNTIPALVWHVW